MKIVSMLVMATCASLIPSTIALAEEVTPQRYQVKPTALTSTLWIGFAVAPNGRVFQTNEKESEISARAAAKGECEEKTARTCNVIAVPPSWDVSVVKCNRGAFVGGSLEGSARDVAEDKASQRGIYGCVETFKY